eukprot:12448897-Ditylum_brightwellii.AAC.1
MQQYLAPGVDNTLFHSNLLAMRSAVLVDISPGKFIKLPPAMMRTRLGSSFLELIISYNALLGDGAVLWYVSDGMFVKKEHSVGSLSVLFIALC